MRSERRSPPKAANNSLTGFQPHVFSTTPAGTLVWQTISLPGDIFSCSQKDAPNCFFENAPRSFSRNPMHFRSLTQPTSHFCIRFTRRSSKKCTIPGWKITIFKWHDSRISRLFRMKILQNLTTVVAQNYCPAAPHPHESKLAQKGEVKKQSGQ